LSLDVAIIDSGGANIASLTGALERLGARSPPYRRPAEIRDASHVILPGVGAAARRDATIARLWSRTW
jgi:imidazole glycerol-phosphate synthase subunit HisH